MTLLLRTGGTLWGEIGVLFLIISGHFDILFPKIPTGFIQFSQISVLEGFYNEYLWKYIENQGFNKHQYCFANISGTKAQIFMKFYVVVNFYLVSLSLNFHKDSCINARQNAVRISPEIDWYHYQCCFPDKMSYEPTFLVKIDSLTDRTFCSPTVNCRFKVTRQTYKPRSWHHDHNCFPCRAAVVKISKEELVTHGTVLWAKLFVNKHKICA